MKLILDYETFCESDIRSEGMYKYTAHPSFEVLLVGYLTFDDNGIIEKGCKRGFEAENFLKSLLTDAEQVYAFNAAFETLVTERYLPGFSFKPFVCLSAMALSAGLPAHLDGVSEALNLEHKKLHGTLLINWFCIPCKPCKANKMVNRRTPDAYPVKWQQFEEYCVGDVISEYEVYLKLNGEFNLNETEEFVYSIDQDINRRGVPVDMDFVKTARQVYNNFRVDVISKLKSLTGLENPASLPSLKKYLNYKESLNAEAVAQILENNLLPEAQLNILRLYSLLSKISIAKYEAFEQYTFKGRAHGLFQYCGAGRTGRWAGRGVQLHNMPRGTMSYEEQREQRGALDMALSDNIPNILSALTRSVIKPKKGRVLVIVDYSAIESRVTAYLAGEEWKLEVFKTTGLIYETLASKMFNVPVEGITKHLRQMGKIAELSLGYQGACGALNRNAEAKKLSVEQQLTIVKQWRASNPKTVKLWATLELGVREAWQNPDTLYIPHGYRFGFRYSTNTKTMQIVLPSKRLIVYQGFTINENGMRYNHAFGKSWIKIDTYGGKLLENLSQAVARDCLANLMLHLALVEYPIIAHVHDEVILECEESEADKVLETVINFSNQSPKWAKDLPLKGEGSIREFYSK